MRGTPHPRATQGPPCCLFCFRFSLFILSPLACCLSPSCLQIAGATEFSLDVATTVLRCYQLQPSTANKELIAKTLLRALMQLPRPDYKICIHLLPEKLVVSHSNSRFIVGSWIFWVVGGMLGARGATPTADALTAGRLDMAGWQSGKAGRLAEAARQQSSTPRHRHYVYLLLVFLSCLLHSLRNLCPVLCCCSASWCRFRIATTQCTQDSEFFLLHTFVLSLLCTPHI